MLTIRDERVRAMARELAERRGVTMTQAVSDALANELGRDSVKERLLAIGRRSAAQAGPNARPMSREEIDAMWER